MRWGCDHDVQTCNQPQILGCEEGDADTGEAVEEAAWQAPATL